MSPENFKQEAPVEMPENVEQITSIEQEIASEAAKFEQKMDSVGAFFRAFKSEWKRAWSIFNNELAKVKEAERAMWNGGSSQDTE